MFDRCEHTDIAPRGVEGPDEGDRAEDPQLVAEEESGPRAKHEHRGPLQHRAVADPAGIAAGREGHERGTGERRAREEPQPAGAETERSEVQGQEDGDEAVTKTTQAARTEHPPRIARRTVAGRPPKEPPKDRHAGASWGRPPARRRQGRLATVGESCRVRPARLSSP